MISRKILGIWVQTKQNNFNMLIFSEFILYPKQISNRDFVLKILGTVPKNNTA